MKMTKDYSKVFMAFLEDNDIFNISISRCKDYLKNWWELDSDNFKKVFGQEYDVVSETFEFKLVEASFNNNYLSTPFLNYISICIYICDTQGNDIVEYVAYYDENLNNIDQKKM